MFLCIAQTLKRFVLAKIRSHTLIARSASSRASFNRSGLTGSLIAVDRFGGDSTRRTTLGGDFGFSIIGARRVGRITIGASTGAGGNDGGAGAGDGANSLISTFVGSDCST